MEFYNRIKPANPQFELIFVSNDHSDEDMEAYMKSDRMPWPAIAYKKIKSNKRLTSYAGAGIPCLVFVDANGNVLSDSYVSGSYVGPAKVLADIEKTLKANPGDPKASGDTKSAGVKGSNFDDFFKKK